MLHFGGNTLNEKLNLFISNYKKSSVPEILCAQMVILDMYNRL